MKYTKKDFSEEAISFENAKEQGKKIGSYLTRKQGFGPEFWEIQVYEIDGKLFGGVDYMNYLEPMLEETRESILKKCKAKVISS